MTKLKMGQFILFFILVTFVATAGVVSSPSLLYNTNTTTKVTNNIETVFATTDEEQETDDSVEEEEESYSNDEEEEPEPEQEIQQQQEEEEEQSTTECTEDNEIFNEDTQMCEEIKEEEEEEEESSSDEEQEIKEEEEEEEEIQQQGEQIAMSLPKLSTPKLSIPNIPIPKSLQILEQEIKKKLGCTDMVECKKKFTEQLKKQLNFSFKIPYIIPSTTLGGEIGLKGNALNLKNTDVSIRFLGFDLIKSKSPLKISSDGVIKKSYTADVVPMVKDLVPVLKGQAGSGLDVPKAIGYINKIFKTEISKDIVQAKVKLDFTYTLPIKKVQDFANSILKDPKQFVKVVTSANKIKNKLYDMKPTITIVLSECHSNSIADIKKNICKWNTLKTIKS